MSYLLDGDPNHHSKRRTIEKAAKHAYDAWALGMGGGRQSWNNLDAREADAWRDAAAAARAAV